MSTEFAISDTVIRKKKKSFDKHELLESKSATVRNAYSKAFNKDSSSLTTVIGNDVASRFRVANARLSMTGEQREVMQEIEAVMRRVESIINPDRLYFSIRISLDDEVILNHRQVNGLCSLVIYDDGAIALARIYAQDEEGRKDELKFIDAHDADYESIVLQFLSGQ